MSRVKIGTEDNLLKAKKCQETKIPYQATKLKYSKLNSLLP